MNDKYLVILISCYCYPDENDLIKVKFSDIEDDWIYILTNGMDYKKDEVMEDFNFVLINQCKWNDNGINSIINAITKKCKRKIVWSHQSRITIEGRECAPVTQNNIIEKGITPYIFKPFSHTTNSVPETFLRLLKGDNKYEAIFNYLIKESLKKPNHHLIALSILCQGYLAAHGGEGLNELDDSFKGMLVADAPARTERIEWWDPVLKDNGVRLKNELQQIEDNNNGKEAKENVPKLISEIEKAKNGGTISQEKVKLAYKTLKKILRKPYNSV